MLGSVIESKSNYAFSAPAKNTSNKSFSPPKEDFSSEIDLQKYKFRKNSEQRVEVVS